MWWGSRAGFVQVEGGWDERDGSFVGLPYGEAVREAAQDRVRILLSIGTPEGVPFRLMVGLEGKQD